MAQTNPWELPVAGGAAPADQPRGVVIPKSKTEIDEEERQAEELLIKKRGEVREEEKFKRQIQDLTVDQSKALDFYQRARSSQIELERLNLDPDDLIALATQEVLPSNLANRFSDTDRRLYRAAAKNFAMATLRRESGAQIASDEIANQISIFFPGAGADEREKQVLKRQRDLTILGLGSAAGPYGLEQANKNLQSLGFIDEQGNPIIETVEPETGEKGVIALRVAEGDRFATDKDIENASLMQGAWQSGKSIDELQALAKSLKIDPLSPETIKELQNDPKRTIIWTPARSGIREGAEPSMGMGSAIGAGSIRGFTGNLAEEALSLVDAEAAAKLQAATDFAQQQRPYSGFVGEAIGSTLSPISRFLPGGPLAKDVLEGAIYGIGEGRPGTDLVERLKTGATGGILQGGFGAAARRFMPGGATPEGAGIPEGEFVNVTGEVPAGMAPEMPMGAAPAPSAVPTGAPTGMAPPTAGMAPPIAGEAIEEAAVEIGRDELIDLARKAVSRTPGASRAKAELAQIAKTNPEAQAAAERLGLELPVDVLSDNSQLKAVTGLTRSQIGSSAQTAWAETYKEAAERGYQAMDELEAITDISQVSADVFNRIDNANKGLGTRAANLRDEVTDTIDSRGRVDTGGIKTWLQNRIDDLGGGKEGIANLSSEEKRLWATVSKGNPTYAALNEQRDLIGQALEKTTGPWANSNTKKLKEIYGALADDQINFIESTAGKEIADKQRAANTLFKQMYEGREQMERLYGKNLSGSIAPLMQRAITEGGKGNVQSFNTLVKIIPEDMRGSVLSSALFKAAGTTDEKFSFTKFADLYKGLRDNSVVYKQFAQAVGPEGDKLLTDFYAISRRLSDADKAIQRTGASTQLDLLNSERLITQIVKSVGAGSAVAGVTSVLGGDIAVPVLGALATVAPQIASKYGKTNVDKLHNLMKSEEFRELAVSAATGDNLNKNINRVAGSKTFREYAKIANIDMKDARNWLNSAISKGATIAGTEAVGSKPDEAPTVEMPQ
jgi:hypothetical protein